MNSQTLSMAAFQKKATLERTIVHVRKLDIYEVICSSLVISNFPCYDCCRALCHVCCCTKLEKWLHTLLSKSYYSQIDSRFRQKRFVSMGVGKKSVMNLAIHSSIRDSIPSLQFIRFFKLLCSTHLKHFYFIF